MVKIVRIIHKILRYHHLLDEFFIFLFNYQLFNDYDHSSLSPV